MDSGFSRSRKQSHAGKVGSGTRALSLLCPDNEGQGGGGERGDGTHTREEWGEHLYDNHKLLLAMPTKRWEHDVKL